MILTCIRLSESHNIKSLWWQVQKRSLTQLHPLVPLPWITVARNASSKGWLVLCNESRKQGRWKFSNMLETQLSIMTLTTFAPHKHTTSWAGKNSSRPKSSIPSQRSEQIAISETFWITNQSLFHPMFSIRSLVCVVSLGSICLLLCLTRDFPDSRQLVEG